MDLTGWDTDRTEVAIDTLWRTDLDLTWDATNDRLVFHASDRPAVTKALDRFRDAPMHDIDQALDRLWDDDHGHEEDD